MRFKKVIKKIVAFGTGVALVGSTIMGAAAAADLVNYPKPFIKDGQFNSMIVVGDTAAPADIIGAIDIAASLQYNMKVETPVKLDGKSTTTTTVANAKKIESSGTKLKYGEDFTSIVETVLPEDLPTVLVKDGKVKGDDDNYDYKTSIKVPNTKVLFGEPGDEESPIIHLDLNGDVAWKEVVEFSPALDPKDVTDSKIILFGKEYSFSGEENDLDSSRLVLYAGAIDQTFTAGDTATIDGDIDIEVIGVNTQSDNAEATLKVNGETKQIEAGKSYNIGGEEIYVKDIFAYTAPTTSGAVRLFIGSDRIVLEDGAGVEMGKDSNEIDGTNVEFTTSGDKISRIEITVKPSGFDDDVDFVAVGEEGISDPVFGTFKIMLNNVIPSIDKNGTDVRDEIKFSPNSDDLRVEWTSKNDITYSLNMFYTEGTTDVLFGNSVSRKIVVGGDGVVNKDDYFIISNKGYSHILQLTRARDDEITVKDDGTTHEFSVTNGAGTMYFDGYAYDFEYNSKDKITVLEGLTDTVVTMDGAELTFTVDSVEVFEQYPAGAVNESSIVCDNYTEVDEQPADYDGGLYYIDETTISCPDVDIVLSPVFNETVEHPGYSLETDIGCENDTYGLAQAPLDYSSITFNGTTYVDITSIECDTFVDTSTATYTLYNVGADIPETGVMTSTGARVIVNEESEYNEASGTSEESANEYIVEITNDNEDINIDIDAPNAYNINDGDNYVGLTPYGTVIEYGDNDQDIKLYYYEGATTFDAFIAPVDSEITKTVTDGGSSYMTESTKKISVGMAKLASEVGDITSQNLISIGGPCVNAVSAALMGNPSNCAFGFEEGKAKIKLFEHTNGNVAMMVAGYSAQDTKRATRIVSDYDQYVGYEGTELEVMGTTMNDISVSVPVPVTTTTTTIETTTTTTLEE